MGRLAKDLLKLLKKNITRERGELYLTVKNAAEYNALLALRNKLDQFIE